MTNRSKELRKRLKESHRRAKESGKRKTEIVTRKELAAAYPGFGQDPRSAFTPDMVQVDMTPMEAILVEELRKLCTDAGTDFAIRKLSEVQTLGPRQVVYLLRQDLDALKGKIATAEHIPGEEPDLGPIAAPEAGPQIELPE